MESDDHYGATLAAIAVGSAPDGYAASEAAQKGVAKIKTYLANNPPPTLHHQAMILWAARNLDGLMTAEEKEACKSRLHALQHDDGGWGLATLGDWKREDGAPQDTAASDGYGTGFVVYVLHGAGVPADSEAITRGVRWLKTHQRASGRWFTRSLHKDNMHFITHAGTAMAVLALSTCDPGE
jgi:squalene-hopene/tetraprenyl-beta-curcumene cyclase